MVPVRDVAGMSVLITGGGSGIGAATAARFASLGARVTISGRRAEKVASMVDSIGTNCTGVVGDVTVADDRRAMFVSSAYTTPAFPGAEPYAATKVAIETLTAVLATELGPQGVRVSCVRPGAAIEFVSRAEWITGEVLSVDGGLGLGHTHT